MLVYYQGKSRYNQLLDHIIKTAKNICDDIDNDNTAAVVSNINSDNRNINRINANKDDIKSGNYNKEIT